MKISKTFTLVELILVVAIIAVLAGVMVPMISSARQRARVAKVLILAETLRSAAQNFNADTGRLPLESSTGPHELFSESTPIISFPPVVTIIPGWDGPYISEPLSIEDSPYKAMISLQGGGLLITNSLLSFSNTPLSDARLINDALDSNEPGAWDTTGKVLYVSGLKLVLIRLFTVKMN